MATEKRLDLISRTDLIKAVEAKHFAISDNTHPYEAIRIQGKYFREVVENAPTVDAVEMVFCDECTNHGKCTPEDTFRLLRIEKPFCCVGSRKTNINCKDGW